MKIIFKKCQTDLSECTKAYVAGPGSGRIKERPVKMLETITVGNGPEGETSPLLSLDIEAKLI